MAMPKQVLALIFDGHTEWEFEFVVFCLTLAGCEVTVIAPDEKPVVGAFHQRFGLSKVGARPLSEINPASYDALFIPGAGEKAKAAMLDPNVQKLIQWFNQKKRLIAAICGGPRFLDVAGILEGRRWTSIDQERRRIEDGEPPGPAVVVDSNLITASDRGFVEFTMCLLEALGYAEVAQELQNRYGKGKHDHDVTI